jgi:TonB-dependent receptor
MSQRLPSRHALSLAVAAALFATVPVAAQNASTPPSVDEETAELDAVLVTGVRSAIFNARQIERDNDAITNVVSADDVGQFSDQSVAESLQRVPGIGVDRDAGEARRLSVRGLGPLFNPVRLNGMLIGSSDLDRDAVVDVLPNDLLGTLEVTKTLTPNMDGDAIGGAVNLKAIDPFERDAGGSIRVEAGQQDYSGATVPKINGIYTNAFDLASGGRLGFSLAASYAERELEGDIFRNRDTPTYLRVGGTCDPADSAVPCFLSSVRAEQRFDISERERAGVSANVDWIVNDSHELYFRAVASTFDRSDTSWNNRYQWGTSDATAIGPNSGTFRRVQLRQQLTFTEREEQTWMGQLGGTSRGDVWRFDYMLGFSSNEAETPEQLTGRFRARNQVIDLTQGEDFINIVQRPGTGSGDPFNPANYLYDNLTLVIEDRRDDIATFKIDASRELEFADRPGRISFGVKTNRRDKSVDREEGNGDPSAATSGFPPTTLNNIGRITVPTRTPNFGFQANPADARALFNATRGVLARVPGTSAGEDYSVEEDVDAAYAMASVELTPTLQLITGVRFETTDWVTGGNELDSFENADGEETLTVRALPTVANSYDNFLPSVHFRWNVRDDMVVRAAWTTAVVRPNFDEASVTRSFRTVEDEDAPGTFSREFDGGNPLLKPLTANQFDVSWAWYPSASSFLYVGAFYKQIDDFYVTGTFTGPDVARAGLPVADGTATGGFDRATVFLNGDEATVQGLEIGFEKAFVELPGWASGLFVGGNVTLLDSESEVSILRPGEVLPLPDQADRLANLSTGWENDRFTIRVSANLRGEQLDTVATRPELDQVLQEYISYDANVRWNINDAFQVYFDATNLNERKDVTVFRGDGSGGFPADEAVNDFGRSFALGVIYRF